MQREPDCVIDGLPSTERLVTAFVGDNPHSSSDGSLEKPVYRPKKTICQPPRHDWLIDERAGKIQGCNSKQIYAKICGRPQQRPFKAVRRDCFAKRADSEVWLLYRYSMRSLGSVSVHNAGVTTLAHTYNQV